MYKQLSPTPILSVSGLRVERGRTVILRDISWRVARGEHWVILGPNGCGKTSLLRALTGYLPPTAGEIAVLGEIFGESDWRDLRTRIGLVTSALQTSIPSAEPVIETVMSGKFAQLNLWAKTTRRDAAQARRWLRAVGLAQLEKREWLLLSHGERQRVLIARALMARPKLLILDEPCSGLDPVARQHFLEAMNRLAHGRGSPSLVLVTHHVEEVTTAFTHALLLRAGEVAGAGELRATLTSRSLSHTFGTPVQLRRDAAGYRLSISARRTSQAVSL